jgi:hypothetical protein
VTRQRPTLRAPRANEELRGFPASNIETNQVYWRVVREPHGPWWFGSTLNGRFDLPAPEGTCYLASDDLGAMLERLGPQLLPGGIVPESLLSGRVLRALRFPRHHRVANCLAQHASKWVTAEISTLTPYDLPQAWAAAFHRAGFQGIRYAPRHSTSRRTHSLAIFGAAGERNEWPMGRKVPLGTSQMRRRLRERCGITVFATPLADELVFAKLPNLPDKD